VTEVIEIYNANMVRIGEMDRRQAHIEGRWHKTFHLWIVDRSNESLLFQKRSPHVENFPSMLDITAAGHLEKDEDVQDGIREVEEELGIKLLFEDMHFLGYRVEVADQENGQFNREYQAVYLIDTDLSLNEYKPDPDEVYGIIRAPIRDCLSLFSKKIPHAKANGLIYSESKRTWDLVNCTVELSDFIPRIQPYYLTISIMAERLLEKRFPLGIS
jgi:isopentenyldiphosphate isomerase